MVRRLFSEAGETLVESLVSLLIATLCFTFLAMSIMLVAKANAAAASSRVPLSDSAFVTDGDVSVEVSGSLRHVDVDMVRQVVRDDEGEVRYVRYVAP